MLSVTCTNKVLADEALPPTAERCSHGSQRQNARGLIATSAARRAAGGQMTQPPADRAERHLASGAPAPGTGGGVYKAGQESSDRARTAASNRRRNADDRKTQNTT